MVHVVLCLNCISLFCKMLISCLVFALKQIPFLVELIPPQTAEITLNILY
jgi:hypothetical protein